METINIFDIPGTRSSAVFMQNSAEVFRETGDISPVRLSDKISYMPWGADNMMPYDIAELIERDETLSTCQMFNAEICYGAGLNYVTDTPNREIYEFFESNDIASLFLGQAIDLKYYAFTVTVLRLSRDHKKIVAADRKEACYCRFAPADKSGNIPYVHYANWRQPVSEQNVIGSFPVLNRSNPLADLKQRAVDYPNIHSYAIITRVPTSDSTYYPIPYYASIFRSGWYRIKHLIATAKEAKMKNHAPIKYQIEISNKYWENIFRTEGITNPQEKLQRVNREKAQILEFLTGVENSGKAWFSTFYVTPDGHEQHDVVINRIDSGKEGGDYESDIQEAINIICFTMRVHSNLVGSVPGKSQSNNSGSDKRELYTIAQALQKPYHDIMLRPHRLIIAFNGWRNCRPEIPFIQLTTLDEHRDSKQVEI